MKSIVLIPALITLMVGCEHDPLPPKPKPYNPSDRDSLGTPIGDACLRLRILGCAEGFRNRIDRTCFESYMIASELANVPAECIKASATVEDVRQCGDANAIRVRCKQ